jgi:hypothetical protein
VDQVAGDLTELGGEQSVDEENVHGQVSVSGRFT